MPPEGRESEPETGALALCEALRRAYTPLPISYSPLTSEEEPRVQPRSRGDFQVSKADPRLREVRSRVCQTCRIKLDGPDPRICKRMPIPQTKQRDIVCRILAEQRKHPVGFFWLQGLCTCIPAGGDAEQAWHCTKHRAHFINWLINQSICLLSSSGPPGFCTTHARRMQACSESAASLQRAFAGGLRDQLGTGPAEKENEEEKMRNADSRAETLW